MTSDLISSENNERISQNFMSRSNIYTESYSFKWSIGHFSMLTSGYNDQEITSPVFNKTFSLIVKPFDRDRVSIFLHSSAHCNVTCEISLIDKIFNKRNSQSFKYVLANSKPEGFTNFISRHYLLNPENGLLPNETMTILCELSTHSSELATTAIHELKMYSPKIQSSIEDDLFAMYFNKKHCDFCIKIANRSFYVHKVILAARSKMLAAMLDHGTQEAENNSVELEDHDPDAVEQVVHYIYTNKCPRIAELASDILPVSDYFEIKGLRELCVETLVSQLNPENASSVFILADMHSVKELKCISADYIKLHLKEVSNSPGWMELKYNKSWLDISSI